MSDRIRIDEPGYVARYRAARGGAESADPDPDVAGASDDVPSYLRAYRSQRAATSNVGGQAPTDAPVVATPPSVARAAASELANDVFIVRHAEFEQTAEDAGLTEQGAWQAHSYGRRLATEFADGDRAVIGHGATPRCSLTAEHIASGLAEACSELGKRVEIAEPEAMTAFANFRFAGPEGPVDISEAFRAWSAGETPAWRTEAGAEPLWAFELERFWNVQIGGGDPVELWLTTPSLHTEPASMVVRRMWRGIRSLGDRHPGARLIVATHGGCVRAFAIAALGYDPGDPYNAEHVRARILAGRSDAIVSYRNRYQEICVPEIAELPVWQTRETWQPPRHAAAS